MWSSESLPLLGKKEIGIYIWNDFMKKAYFQPSFLVKHSFTKQLESNLI